MNRLTTLVSVTLAGAVIAACGGGGGGASAPATAVTPPATTTSNAGLWKGTVTSSGQPQEAVGTVGDNGQFHLSMANGMTFVGTMQGSGTSFSMNMTAYMPEGQTFPNGAPSASMAFAVTMTGNGMMTGTYSGAGQSGSFSLAMDAMGSRSASLQAVAGTYTRSNSTGYTVTMTIGANGQLTGSNTRGCVFNGAVSVPSPTRNQYSISMTVTSCGALDGNYTGMGTLVDASSMTNWMTTMRSSMMSGGMMAGTNVIPTGTSNLFMYAVSNGQRAIMDSLAK
jgi:hypothetical protein